MALELEKNCPCSKVGCERHGNCVACFDYHKNMEKPSTCRRPESTVSSAHAIRVKGRLRAAGRIA